MSNFSKLLIIIVGGILIIPSKIVKFLKWISSKIYSFIKSPKSKCGRTRRSFIKKAHDNGDNIGCCNVPYPIKSKKELDLFFRLHPLAIEAFQIVAPFKIIDFYHRTGRDYNKDFPKINKKEK